MRARGAAARQDVLAPLRDRGRVIYRVRWAGPSRVEDNAEAAQIDVVREVGDRGALCKY